MIINNNVNEPSVAIVTPIFNRIGNLARYFDSLENINYKNFKIVIVDDGSTDGSSQFVKEHHPDAVLLLGDGNLWWAGATNKGMEWAFSNGFDYILTFNDDQVVDKEFLKNLVLVAQKSPNSVLSSHVFSLNHGITLHSPGIVVHTETGNARNITYSAQSQTHEPYEVDIAPGYSVLIPRSLISEVGYFDSKRFPQIFMEGEYCLRVKRAGYKVIMVPNSKVWNDLADKNSDPIKSKNIFKRMNWFLTNRKSHLEIKQNYNYYDVIVAYKATSLALRVKMWIHYLFHYLIQMTAAIFFPREVRQTIKKIIKGKIR